MNVRSLFGKVGVYIFRAVVIGSVFVGAIFAVTFVWEITDTVTADGHPEYHCPHLPRPTDEGSLQELPQEALSRRARLTSLSYK